MPPSTPPIRPKVCRPESLTDHLELCRRWRERYVEHLQEVVILRELCR